MDIRLFDIVDVANAQEFLDANALSHETVFTELLSQGVALPHYPLWIEQAPDQPWLDLHYQEHLSWSAQLRIDLPPDLTDVDFDDEESLRAWLYVHALHHQQVNAALDLV